MHDLMPPTAHTPHLTYPPLESSYGYATRLLKVSKGSNVKTVAGSIAHTTRAGESPTLMATGMDSVNQAIKAMAIARGYLEENKLDLTCHPEFRNPEKGAISFILSKAIARGKPIRNSEQSSNVKFAELRVAGNSVPSIVAGSIANKVRSGERVSITCLGPQSVNSCVKSIIAARRYLVADAIDIGFRPEFVHLKLDEGERSALKFNILSQQV